MKYKFGDIVHYINDKRMPAPEDRLSYIGLEHLDTGSLQVTRWGSDVDITGQKLIMHKGDILFGRRNTYLKRVAIAPHDGLFSAHGMIWRPREEIVDRDFFIHFVASDYFLDEAIRISVGSLSPTVNWRDLKELEFEIPAVDIQKKIAVLMQAMERAKTAYKNLIAKTDELVKSQFIEMFGDPANQHENLTSLGEHIDLLNGFAFKGELFTENAGIPVIKIGNVNRADFRVGSMQYYNCDSSLDRFIIRPGDLLISLTGTAGKDDFGNACFVDNSYEMYYLNQRNAKLTAHPEINSVYLLHLLKNEYIRGKLIESGTGIRQCHLHNKDIDGIMFSLPPIESQNLFARFVKESDKSKLAAQQSLTDLVAAQKALMRQYLG